MKLFVLSKKPTLFVAVTNPNILGFGVFFKRIVTQVLVFGLDGYVIPIPCHLTEVFFIMSCP